MKKNHLIPSNDVELKLSDSKPFSPIKWQREQALKKLLRLKNDRAALPILNREAIITYRLPFHEAIIRKMDKNGFEHTAEYIRQLLAFQDSYRNAAGEESIIWQRPSLKYEQDVLQHLADGLQMAEKAHNSKKIHEEIDIILGLAIEYCFGSENWWWLSHQLLFTLMNIVQDYEKESGKRTAFVRFIFGKFLFENAKEPDMALEHLKIARKLTTGMSWNVNVMLKDKNNTVFSESCILIHKILISKARAIMKKDPKTAMEICDKARKRAKEACFNEGVAASHTIKGNCQMALFDTENAIKSYIKGMEIIDDCINTDLKCELLRNLSIAYLKHGNLNLALNTLHQLKEYAQINDRLLYVAQAHKYLGEYYLKEGTARNATPLLMTAVKIFNKVGAIAEMAKTRNLAAISVGIEMMPVFSQIVRASDPKFADYRKEALGQLLRWKDERESFWDKSQITDMTPISIHAMETLSSYSKENRQEIPDVDVDLVDVEQILGVTGLDVTSNEIVLPNEISIPGVEFAGNTVLPSGTPLSITDEDSSNDAAMLFLENKYSNEENEYSRQREESMI